MSDYDRGDSRERRRSRSRSRERRSRSRSPRRNGGSNGGSFPSRERRGPPENAEELYSIKIDNLASDAVEQDLKDYFEKFGDVGDTYVPQDKYRPGHNRGFGFVRFVKRSSMEDAIDEMQDVEMMGKRIHVEEAAKRPPRRPRGDYDDRRGGGRGGGYNDRRGSRDDYRRDDRRDRYDDRRRRSRSRSRGRY